MILPGMAIISELIPTFSRKHYFRVSEGYHLLQRSPWLW